MTISFTPNETFDNRSLDYGNGIMDNRNKKNNFSKSNIHHLLSIILFASYFLLPNAGSAQTIITPQQYINAAESAVAKGDYNTALEYYQIVIKDHPTRYDLYMNAADAAIQLRHYRIANYYLDGLIKNGNPKDYPLISYKRGLVKKNTEEYDLAISSFEKYLTDFPTGEAAAMAKEEIANCEWAKTLVFGEKKYEINHLDSTVNSIYIDGAPFQNGNNLLYTSGFVYDSTKAPVTHIFSKELGTNKPGLPITIAGTQKSDHIANYTLSTNGQTGYYNLCTQNEDGSFICSIYKATVKTGGQNELSGGEKLDSFINKPGYTSTQPAIGFDSVLNSEVLYFTSNRPGGKGGLDIWRSLVDANSRVSKPENVAELNTAKDELTPSFFTPAQVLFFSTDGYKSLGGYDIYLTKRTGTTWSAPENAGYPLNSSFDDLYYSVGNGKAFFSSNRPGGMCGAKEKDCVCDDIYSYDLKADLKAETLLAGTTQKLDGVNLSLVDLSSGAVTMLKSDSIGSFASLLEFGKSYRLVGSKFGFMSDSVEFNTKNLYQSKSIYQKLSLLPNAKITTYVFDKIDRKPINGSTITISDKSGKILVKSLVEGNSYTYSNVSFGSVYYIKVDKDKYDSDSSIVVIDGLGKSFKTEYADSLYLGSFQGLPLTLYFDNDEPNPRTRLLTTDYTYGQTYDAYYYKKPEYLTNFYGAAQAQTLTGNNEITDFFENRIKYGHDKLEEFCSILLRFLSAGHGLEMKIQGYASPLAESDYNQILSARRISSVINHFKSYQGGVLMEYVKNGHLRIQLEPNGASTANGVPSDPKDRRNSVYSVPAMQERRVQILEINRMDLPIGDANGHRVLRGLYAFGEKRTLMGSGFTSKNGLTLSKNGSVKGGLNLNSQASEVVLVDAYTGAIIHDNSNIEVYDALTNKLMGKARKRGNNYTYNVEGGSDFLIKAGSSGYGGKSFNTVLYNYYEGEAVVDTMFLTPFGELPLPLYFDNNRPGSDAQDLSLMQSDFYSRKSDFIKMYNKLISATGGDGKVAEEDMRLFFDAEVKDGYKNLVGFTGLMKTYLQKGYNLEVQLEGYASSLSNPEYNNILSERRTQSIISYLTALNGGVLKKFIKNGQLKIKTETIGSAISQAPNDKTNPASVYGLEASHDRKVVIKDIIIKK